MKTQFTLSLLPAGRIGHRVRSRRAQRTSERRVGVSADCRGSLHAEVPVGRHGAGRRRSERLIAQKRDDNHYLVQDYVKKGQTGTTWDSLVTYLNTVRPDESIMDFMNRQKGIMEKKCSGAGWQILSQAESEIVYESKVASCPGVGDQDEIVRVIYGQANMFRISYTSKVKEMPPAQRVDALKLLSEFQVQQKS